MPDISMCLNKECSLSVSCYRFKAVPNKYQSYMHFYPTVVNGKTVCGDYEQLASTYGSNTLRLPK